jgi:hypothetical protein
MNNAAIKKLSFGSYNPIQVREIIQEGISILSAGDTDRTPLMYAALTNTAEAVSIPLDAGDSDFVIKIVRANGDALKFADNTIQKEHFLRLILK